MKPKRQAPLDLAPFDLSDGLPRDQGLFLKRLDAAALRHELQAAGLLTGLESRGYAPVEIRVGRSGGDERLQVFGAGEREALVDLRVSEESRIVSGLAPRPRGIDVLSVLSIHWLEMQDPRAPFTRERPQLPGQRHPGLRLTRALILRIHDWGRAWGKDAVLNVPEYYHNAMFYSAAYRFLSAERQGRFLALRRDLAALSVPEASAAIDAGRVIELSTGRRFEWDGGEMAAPLTEPLRAYLDGPEWGAAVAQARDRHRFALAG